MKTFLFAAAILASSSISVHADATSDQFLYESIRDRIYMSLQKRLSGMGGWTTIHYNRPSYPFVMDILAKKAFPIADQAVANYRKNAIAVVSGFIQGGDLYTEVMHSLGIPHPPENPIFRKEFTEMMIDAVNAGDHYTTRGTVFTASWGSGDSDSRSGIVPCEGYTTASSMAGSFVSYFQSRESALREYLRKNPGNKPTGLTVGTRGYYLESNAWRIGTVVAIGDLGVITIDTGSSYEPRKNLRITEFSYLIAETDLPVYLKERLGKWFSVKLKDYYEAINIYIDGFYTNDNVLIQRKDGQKFFYPLDQIFPGYYCDDNLKKP